jgi:predicted DNA-binding transcriptional regulator YafY
MNVLLLSRCLQLVSLLYSQAGYSVTELARQLGVSTRTVYRYIEVLRTVGIPVQFDERKSGYVISPQFRLKVSQLTEDELALLILAAQSSPIAGHGELGKIITRASSKLLSQAPLELRTEAANLLQACEIAADARFQSQEEHDLCLQILTAIRQQRQIRLTYQTGAPGESTIQTKVVPYRLVLQAEDAHLFGHSSWHRKAYSFQLRQITRIEITEDGYSLPRAI